MNFVFRIHRYFPGLQGVNIPAIDQRNTSGSHLLLFSVNIKICFTVQQIVDLDTPVPVLQNHIIDLPPVQAKLHRHLLILCKRLMIK